MGTAVLGEKTKKSKLQPNGLKITNFLKLNLNFTCSRQIFFEILLQPNGLRTEFPPRTCTMGTAVLGEKTKKIKIAAKRLEIYKI
jgi:hypothetical protein